MHYPSASEWGLIPWFKDRAIFAYAACLKPLRWLVAGRQASTSPVIAWDASAGDPQVAESRTYFLDKAFGEKPAFIGHNERYPTKRLTGLFSALRLWVKCVAWSAQTWFDVSPTRYSWLGFSLATAMDFEAIRGSCERLYVFAVHFPPRYLAASYAHQALGMDVRLVDSSTPLFRYLRITHLDCELVLCSRIQEYELAYYGNRGLNRARGVYAGNENALQLSRVILRPPTFHLAYYSSGMWARQGGIVRSSDIAGIREGNYADNPYAKKTREILETMAELARDRGLRFKIYPHPYERLLLRDHGIEPPYTDLVDGRFVFFDAEGEDSRALMGEAAIAVSLQSTLIFERLDAGYQSSYVFRWGDPARDVFEPAAAGPFADRCFESMEVLRAVIERDLALVQIGSD